MIYKNVEISDSEVETQKWVVNNKRFLNHIDVKDKVVMDVGGFIGSFAIQCIEHGAKEVISYEPHPVNFELLSKNSQRIGGITPIAAALVGDNKKYINLCLHAKYSAMTSMVKKHKNNSGLLTKVKALNFNEEVIRIKPNIVKVDAEGAEYSILNGGTLPECVSCVIVEVHYAKSKEFKELHDRMLFSFSNWKSGVLIPNPNPRDNGMWLFKR